MKSNKKITRRNFITTGAVAATTVITGFPFVRTSPAKEKPLKIGLIGCGGRGTGAVEDCITSSPDIHLVALADLFPDRIQRCLETLKQPKKGKREKPLPNIEVKEDHCFSGFDCHKKLLETDVDLVLLAEPPGFRLLSFPAAIDAGKHVFIEKPVAVDPVGCRKIMEAGKKAKQKGLAVVAGTQRRHQKSYVETIKRIHNGQIGEVVSGQCYWNGSTLWHHGRDPQWTEMEYQIRNWYYFCWLSGDHIVEQHLHNIDVINWAIGTHPIRALGVGGRQARTDPKYGYIYDHFAVDFEYPNNVHVMSMCCQYEKTDTKIGEFVIGTKGKSDPSGEILSPNKWKFEGESTNPYVQEHADLIASIRSGNPLNEAQNVAESTMSLIMGRESTYTGKAITWDEIMSSNLDLSPIAYDFNAQPPKQAVPMPGQPRA